MNALALRNLAKRAEDHPGGHCWPYFDPRELCSFGLTEDQSRRLFILDFWPEAFRLDWHHERYMDQIYPGLPSKAAGVLAKRIIHFINTDGRE